MVIINRYETKALIDDTCSLFRPISFCLLFYQDRIHPIQYYNHYDSTHTHRALAGKAPLVIKEIEITETTMKWDGVNNSCQSDDPRQFTSSDSDSVAFFGGGGAAWSSGVATDPNWDPCGTDSLPPKVSHTMSRYN